MRKLISFTAIILGAFSALGMAKTNNRELKDATSAHSTVKPALVSDSNTWTGMLVNRDCFRRSGSAKSCGATTSTNRFMIIDKQGKQYSFDRGMNDRTRLAMQARASRSNPFRTTRTPVYASANAETIRLR
jgi:hypothetical protein